MNGNNKMDVYAYRDPLAYGYRVQLRIRMVDADGHSFLPEPLIWRRLEKEDRGKIIGPFMEMENDEAQKLADALWDAGIRPAGAAGSAGQLGAVQAHLADMRNIVAVKLGVPLSGKAVAP